MYKKCFNPCSDGFVFSTHYRKGYTFEIKGFNPCSDGFVFSTLHTSYFDPSSNYGFNPCSDGFVYNIIVILFNHLKCITEAQLESKKHKGFAFILFCSYVATDIYIEIRNSNVVINVFYYIFRTNY